MSSGRAISVVSSDASVTILLSSGVRLRVGLSVSILVSVGAGTIGVLGSVGAIVVLSGVAR